jgi:large subunit ribosomal protein L17
MRHRRAGKQLGRDSSHRRAVLRNLVTSLFRYEEISTTHAKAKALRPIAEKMITLAKRGDLHARRQALSYLLDKSVAHKLFEQMKDRFSDRQGGYIRILKAGHRVGDNAPLAIVQLLLAGETKKASKVTGKDKKGVKKEAKKIAEKREAPTVQTTTAEPEEGEKSTKAAKGDVKQKQDAATGEKKTSKEKKTSPEKKRGTADKQRSTKDQTRGSGKGQKKAEKPK